ncbi:MAG: T9SS type A sorting domain-containing protein [Ignavibacteriaceae bacterium]|nr:T9SS type A sorting domain-containing protein [Ignavibacteriaceae bacterium]
MKQIFYLTLFAISLSRIGFSQTITFDKTLPSSSATQVLQTDDGGYLLNCSSYLNFIKTNQFGYIEWTKEYPEIIRPGKKISETLDGGYIAVGNKLNGSFTDICLVKLDQNLDTSWTRTYVTDDQSELGQAVIQLPDGSFIISSMDYVKYFLRKTDVNGSLIWTKEIALPPSFITTSFLVNLNDGNFLFGNRSGIIKINSEADTIWSKSILGIIFSYLTNDGYILLSTSDYLQKFDQDGNIIWQKDITNVKSFAQSSNGNYVLLKGTIYLPSSCEVIMIDTGGNILSETSFENWGECISGTEDGGFAVCGSVKPANYFYYTWLLKTDNNINYDAVNLKQPLDGKNLNIFSTYPITWKANNVNYVNIDYSVDNQISWNSIINYFPAEVDTFYWTLPNMQSGNLYLRISDSFDPDIYDRSDPPQTAIYYQSTDYISANEILMWIGNNGMGSHDPRTNGSGFYWPGGDSAKISAIFQDGLVWGGKVSGEIKVNGSTYRYGLKPGRILEDGTADNPLSTSSKIFKIRKDWQTLPEGIFKKRLEYDYNHWPIEAGAPWDDINEDDVYTPGFDNPKFIGDETLFYVANDLDTATSRFTYGSDPIGLEFQTTVFGFNREDLKDVVFKKYKVINKSTSDIEDMYFTYWADDDLGDAGDDYEGFDSTHNMAYVYNGDNDDLGYPGYGIAPPALAHMIIQGPIIPASNIDSARYDTGWRTGFKNLGMTSSGMILKSSSTTYPTDVQQGVYEGTIQFYNTMQGLINDGSFVINPLTNEPTIWSLSGDPVSGVGWYEGDGWPGGPSPRDQRYHAPTGPFNLAAGDTQEIVIAIPIARGTDNINSITKLRELAVHIQEFYNTELVEILNTKETIAPSGYTLYQNYPNPFNPKTTIEYEVPEKANITIKIYDILGREVNTIVNNEEKVRWKYKVEFDASTLSSGVYFYRIQAGSFTQTKKMMVLK